MGADPASRPLILMRYAAKRDGNERLIVETLERMGADVLRLSEPGCPDLLVHYRGRLVLFEVKTKAGHLTPAQERLRARMPFTIVRSVDDVTTALRAAMQRLRAGTRVPRLRPRP